jgi:hypothetical protein
MLYNGDAFIVASQPQSDSSHTTRVDVDRSWNPDYQYDIPTQYVEVVRPDSGKHYKLYATGELVEIK